MTGTSPLPVNEILFMRVVERADKVHSLKQSGNPKLSQREKEEFTQAKRDLIRGVNKMVMNFKNTPHYERALERKNRHEQKNKHKKGQSYGIK